jgi:hypothetical protein
MTKSAAMRIAIVLLLAAGTPAQQLRVTGRSYVAASGQWRSDTEVPKAENNQVKIECDKNISLCAMAQGSNLIGPGNLFTRLDVTPVHYTVLRWDDAGVVAQTLARDCVTDRIVIDFHAKSVTLIETPKSGAEEIETCKNYNKIVTSRLVSQ